MNFKFNIGDKVVIVHKGKTYSTYDTMFRKLNFRDKAYNPAFHHGTEGTVFARDVSNIGDLIYGIRTQAGDECLIEEAGIEKVLEGSEKIVQKEKTYEVDETFLLQAYHEACPEWKKRLKKKFPGAFPSVRFKKGTVLKSTYNGSIVVTLRDVKSTDKTLEGIVIASRAHERGYISYSWRTECFEEYEIKP